MNGCIASQPIFNLKKDIFGYELLYRASALSTEYDGENGDKATRDLIVAAFSEIGIENVTRGRKALINFTLNLILDEVPEMLSNEILVVELLEDIEPSEEVVAACRDLKKKGYLLALDDFVYSEKYESLLQIADIIKIDFLQYDEKELRALTKKINKNRRKILLAEKVETYADFELAVKLGFTLFQGFFFCKPIINSAKHIDALEVSRLKLVGFASRTDVNFFELADVIKQDVVLSYRLLKIVNSAYYGLRYSVKGILHALIILGLKEAKKWLSLIVLEEADPDKPNELIRMAMIRGSFMENIALKNKEKNNRDEYFMTGLFSLADAIMDAPLESILAETHLSEEICQPLLEKTGERADYVKIIGHIEKAEWDEAEEMAKKYGLKMGTVTDCYLEAIRTANALLS